MPLIVACPSCDGKLRVADDLLGRKVRCPACNATFNAAAHDAPAAPLPELHLESEVPTETVEPWKQLRLELADQNAPRLPEGPPAGALHGAVELDEEGQPKPPAKDPEPAGDEHPPARPRRSRARLNDDHDDLAACPECGRMNHLDARWCSFCDTALDEERTDSQRRRGTARRRLRRDCEPHRGGFILAMGIISLAALFGCWPLAPLAVVPGIIAWVLGHADLRKIRAGDMDPEGESSTQAGWICGIIGTCLNTLVILGCGGFFGLMMWSDMQRSKNINRPPPFVAPPQRNPF